MGFSILSDGTKYILVMALSEAVNTTPEQLLVAAINDINVLPIITMRVITTKADDSTIKQDVEKEMEDVIAKSFSFMVFNIGGYSQFLVDYTLTTL